MKENFVLHKGDEERIREIKVLYGGKPVVFFMGQHTKYKGLAHLIEAERYMQSDCVAVIGGNEPLTNKLKSLAELTVWNNNATSQSKP